MSLPCRPLMEVWVPINRMRQLLWRLSSPQLCKTVPLTKWCNLWSDFVATQTVLKKPCAKMILLALWRRSKQFIPQCAPVSIWTWVRKSSRHTVLILFRPHSVPARRSVQMHTIKETYAESSFWIVVNWHIGPCCARIRINGRRSNVQQGHLQVVILNLTLPDSACVLKVTFVNQLTRSRRFSTIR